MDPRRIMAGSCRSPSSSRDGGRVRGAARDLGRRRSSRPTGSPHVWRRGSRENDAHARRCRSYGRRSRLARPRGRSACSDARHRERGSSRECSGNAYWRNSTLTAGALDGRIYVLDEPWSTVHARNAGLAPGRRWPSTTSNSTSSCSDRCDARDGRRRDAGRDSRVRATPPRAPRAIERPVAFWIVHHENKAGDVSGAWERVPDTLVHVQAAGNGHTRFVFRKARWSSENHGRTLNLAWSEGRTFEVVEERERDYYGDVLELFYGQRSNGGQSTEVREATKIGMTSCRSVLAELTRRGDLMFEKGPSGRHFNAHCYRLRSATILRLVPETPEAPSPAPPDDFAF